MKAYLGLLAAFSLVASANAYEFQMTQGKDSFIFDFPDNGRSIRVYQIDENEPHSDAMEGLMHDRFIMEDILNAVPELKEHPLNFWNGRSFDPSVNAFAAIRFGGRRYIVLNPAWLHDHWARIFVLGHELGHHICGHTAGLMRERPWERELEADRFSGMIIRAMEQSGNLTFQEAVGNAMEFLGEQGSVSHPPRYMRLQAAVEGYNSGSPCVGRQVPTGGVASNESYSGGAAPPLWNHNGSVTRLIADGSSRKFIYENPRAGLSTVGIQSGSLLFAGRKNGDSYSGTAYVYSRNCGASAFQVSGTIAADQRMVTMYGKSPKKNGSCQTVDYSDETLTFVFSGD